MALYSYFQYAIVTAIIALILVICSLSVKPWFDETVFTANLTLVHQLNQMDLDIMMGGPALDFESHIESIKGMQNLN